ncbi:MAG: SMI1/KNR4 family protein [Firmicutes bacterium]|nr:SMI1/KNR4 family protein [Bacillota bacterium]
MDILKNLNHRLTFAEGEASYGGGDEIKQVLRESPIQLPEDYIDFLRQISGGDSLGLSFQVDNSKKKIFFKMHGS